MVPGQAGPGAQRLRVGGDRVRRCASGARARRLPFECTPLRLGVAPAALLDRERAEPEAIDRLGIGGQDAHGAPGTLGIREARQVQLQHPPRGGPAGPRLPLHASQRLPGRLRLPVGNPDLQHPPEAELPLERIESRVRHGCVGSGHAIERLCRRGDRRLGAHHQVHGIEHGEGTPERLRPAPDQIVRHVVGAGMMAAERDVAIDVAARIRAVEAQERVLDQVCIGLAVVGMQADRLGERAAVGLRRAQQDAAEVVVEVSQGGPYLHIVRILGRQRFQRRDVAGRLDVEQPPVAVREPALEPHGPLAVFLACLERASSPSARVGHAEPG